MNTRKSKRNWLLDCALEVLEAERGKWLDADAISERIAMRFPEPQFYWNNRSASNILPSLKKRGVEQSKINNKYVYRVP